MRTLFPLSTPRMGLSLTREALTVMTRRRDWRSVRVGRRVHHLDARPVPAGLLTPSTSTLNIADVPALANEVRALLGSTTAKTSIQPVALVLPDLSARVALLSFEAWPSKPAEQAALLRFRFDKELHYAVGSLRLVYQVYPMPSNHDPGTKRLSAGRQVLAAAIRQDILAQYEAVCLEAGCLPIQAGLSSFMVFDRCRAFLERAVGQTSDEAFFVHATPGCVFFLACRNQSPRYVRIKPIRDPHRLPQECQATLQFYDELVGHQVGPPDRPRSLFLIGDATGVAAELEGSLVNIRVQLVRWSDVGVAPHTPSGLNTTCDAQIFSAMSSVWEG